MGLKGDGFNKPNRTYEEPATCVLRTPFLHLGLKGNTPCSLALSGGQKHWQSTHLPGTSRKLNKSLSIRPGLFMAPLKPEILARNSLAPTCFPVHFFPVGRRPSARFPRGILAGPLARWHGPWPLAESRYVAPGLANLVWTKNSCAHRIGLSLSISLS